MQDSISGVVGCTSSRVGRDLVWQFLQENWKSLVTRFGDKSNFLIAFVEVKISIFFVLPKKLLIFLFQYGLSEFADEKIAAEIKAFFETANTPIVTRPVKKVLETIHMRSEVLKRDSKEIEAHLKHQK